jgi:hypothetical protein
MFIEVCSNHGPRWLGGARIGKTISKCGYIKKNLLQNLQAKFNRTWYKLSLGQGNSSLFNSQGPGSLQRGDDSKNVKVGRYHLKIFFQEPLDQKSRNLQERFMVQYKKGSLLKSWPPWVGWGHNEGKCFYICLYREKRISPEPLEQKS